MVDLCHRQGIPVSSNVVHIVDDLAQTSCGPGELCLFGDAPSREAFKRTPAVVDVLGSDSR